MVGIVLAGTVIQKFGTDEQKAEHLRATLAADQLWCQLFSEPGAGSDLGSLATRAERDGERWIVNGQKVWTSGGRYSRLGHPHGSHRHRRAEAQGHLVLPDGHVAARHRGAAVAADDRRGRVRRGLLHRRRDADRRADRARERGLDGRHGDPHERARPHRRVDHRARAPARTDRRDGRRRPRSRGTRSPRLAALRRATPTERSPCGRARSRAPRDRS